MESSYLQIKLNKNILGMLMNHGLGAEILQNEEEKDKMLYEKYRTFDQMFQMFEDKTAVYQELSTCFMRRKLINDLNSK